MTKDQSGRWHVLLILVLVRFAHGFQLQSAGAVTPIVLEEFGSGYSGLGTLVGLYMLPGILLAIPVGFLGQRYGDKPIVLSGLALMVGGGVISAIASDYQMLALGRAIAGIGGVVQLVLLTKLLADWFSDRELYFAMSLFILGWPVGIATGGAFLPDIAVSEGWRFALVLTSLACALCFVMVLFAYRPASQQADASNRHFTQLSKQELLLVTIAGLAWMLVNGGFLVLLAFGPVLLEDRGMTFVEAAAIVSLMSWIPILTMPVGGFLSSRFDIPRFMMVGGLLGSISAIAMMPFIGSPALLFLAYGAFITFATPIIGAMPIQALKPENRASGMGIFMVWNFIGMGVFPALGGLMADTFGGARDAVLFAALVTAAALIAGLLFYICNKRMPSFHA